jgi:hypothetical protein
MTADSHRAYTVLRKVTTCAEDIAAEQFSPCHCQQPFQSLKKIAVFNVVATRVLDWAEAANNWLFTKPYVGASIIHQF